MHEAVYDISGCSPEAQLLFREQVFPRCDFPSELLVFQLTFEKGKSQIPVEVVDLSRYASAVEEAEGHAHLHTADDAAHVIKARERILGLAWYSGKVSIEQSLLRSPELFGEVFWSEAAHMVDFFLLDDTHRVELARLAHPGLSEEAFAEHYTHGAGGEGPGEGDPGSHGWFDVASYREFIGEWFMGAFLVAYTNYPVTIPFSHALPSPEAVRNIVTPVPKFPVHGIVGPYVTRYHLGIMCWVYRWATNIARRETITWQRPSEAIAAGRTPCRVCKPPREP